MDNPGSTWGQTGVNLHRPTIVAIVVVIVAAVLAAAAAVVIVVAAVRQGLTLVHLSARPKRSLWDTLGRV